MPYIVDRKDEVHTFHSDKGCHTIPTSTGCTSLLGSRKVFFIRGGDAIDGECRPQCGHTWSKWLVGMDPFLSTYAAFKRVGS